MSKEKEISKKDAEKLVGGIVAGDKIGPLPHQDNRPPKPTHPVGRDTPDVIGPDTLGRGFGPFGQRGK